MRRILEQIDANMVEYRKAPFLAHLRDPTVDPQAKLVFAPHVAHFVLTFGDLCRFILPATPAKDRYQELVNANCVEDQDHWRWFLTDLAELGLDPRLPLSRAISLVWGERNVRTRILSYNLCHFALGADSITRLVLVHCIEGAFKATVEDLAIASRTYTAETGKPLRYLGARHSDAESSHTLEQQAVRSLIREVALSDVSYEYCRTMVKQTFSLFSAFAEELLDLAVNPPQASVTE